jgi:transcriptional regulator with XRE-family HTH domain
MLTVVILSLFMESQHAKCGIIFPSLLRRIEKRGDSMARKPPIRHDAIVAAFSEKLRQIRRSRGMTQRDLAHISHLTESYISRLESGTIAPGIDLVARLSRALGISIAELLPLDEPPETVSRAVVTEQAKRLFESVLQSQDPSFVLLLAQILSLLAEAVERQR